MAQHGEMVSSNYADGSGAFGRYAQRKVIATAMQSAIAGTDLRDPSTSTA